MYRIKLIIKKILPVSTLRAYHFFLALLASVIYRQPSKHIYVIGITGTKGKSSTSEYLNAILETAGYKTALTSTIRIKTDENSTPNKFKMTMPGRFFLQSFLRKAVDTNCEFAIIEMTSEGAKLFRHKFIYLDALIFTNISPEHIESHGSYDAYKQAKLKIGKALEKSPKKNKVLVINGSSELANTFMNLNIENKLSFQMNDEVTDIEQKGRTLNFQYNNIKFILNQPGIFNICNALGAIKMAEFMRIDIKTIANALQKLEVLPGRLQNIDMGQNFEAVVDYAHTPDSLEQLYGAYNSKSKVCVLGNTGGGRDKWKRKKMAQIATKNCDKIILTDEDPYDEDPMDIINEMLKGAPEAKVILDRRKAINTALKYAMDHNIEAVLITGKGTDPYIMRANGQKEPWSDAEVTKEELQKLLNKV